MSIHGMGCYLSATSRNWPGSLLEGTIWTLFTIWMCLCPWPATRVYTFMLWMCLREWRDRGPKRKREDTVIVTAP
jgi:hypothetical protein